MGISKIYVNNNLRMDLTQTTATATDVAVGKKFFNTKGDLIDGALVPEQKLKEFLEDTDYNVYGSFNMYVPKNTTVMRYCIFDHNIQGSFNIFMDEGASIGDGYCVFGPGPCMSGYYFDFARESDMYVFLQGGPDVMDYEGNSCDVRELKINGQPVTQLIFTNSMNTYCRAGITPTSVTYVEFPETSFNIGDFFMAGGDGSSVTVRCRSEYPPTVYESSFGIGWGSGIIEKVIVPDGCKQNYTNADIWCNIADRIFEESEVTE